MSFFPSVTSARTGGGHRVEVRAVACDVVVADFDVFCVPTYGLDRTGVTVVPVLRSGRARLSALRTGQTKFVARIYPVFTNLARLFAEATCGACEVLLKGEAQTHRARSVRVVVKPALNLKGPKANGFVEVLRPLANNLGVFVVDHNVRDWVL